MISPSLTNETIRAKVCSCRVRLVNLFSGWSFENYIMLLMNCCCKRYLLFLTTFKAENEAIWSVYPTNFCLKYEKQTTLGYIKFMYFLFSCILFVLFLHPDKVINLVIWAVSCSVNILHQVYFLHKTDHINPINYEHMLIRFCCFVWGSCKERTDSHDMSSSLA